MIEIRRYGPGQESEAVPLTELPRVLTERAAGFVWVHGADLAVEELDRLVTVFAMDPLVAEDLRKGRQRTKLIRFPDHFHVALHDCTLHDRHLVSREIDVVLGDGWLLSVVQPQEPGDPPEPFRIEPIRHRFESQRGRHPEADEGLFLWALLDIVVDRWFVATEAVDEALDDLEPVVFSGESPGGSPHQVFALRRSLVDFRRLVSPLREVLNELLRDEVPWVDRAAHGYLRDVEDHVLRVVELVESQRDLLGGMLEAGLTVASNRMNRAMQTISAWGALLIVATLVTGVLGMNFRNAPDVDWPIGFLAVGGVMLAVGLPLFWVFRRRKWL